MNANEMMMRNELIATSAYDYAQGDERILADLAWRMGLDAKMDVQKWVWGALLGMKAFNTVPTEFQEEYDAAFDYFKSLNLF